MALSPEDKQRIYEEEKARSEAQARIKKEAQQAKRARIAERNERISHTWTQATRVDTWWKVGVAAVVTGLLLLGIIGTLNVVCDRYPDLCAAVKAGRR